MSDKQPKVCERCGEPFHKNPKCKPSDWLSQRFCSRSCARSRGKRLAEPYSVEPDKVLGIAYSVARRRRTPDSFLDDIAQDLAMAGFYSLWYYTEGYFSRGVFAYLAWTMNREYKRLADSYYNPTESQAPADDDGFDSTGMVPDHRENSPPSAAEDRDALDCAMRIISEWPEPARSIFLGKHRDGISEARLSGMFRLNHRSITHTLEHRVKLIRDEMSRRTA
jgi:DNA-directed RNA polymerase specialized sigma24 family protein